MSIGNSTRIVKFVSDFNLFVIVTIVLAAYAVLYSGDFSAVGMLHNIVPTVSVTTFVGLLGKAYQLFKAGRTAAAAISAVGSPVLSFAVYALGTWVMSAVATYGLKVVAGW
ncbi:MAG: hypothetical protein ABF754_03690 [Leuconostoc pseudomesenteroides]